MREPTQSIDLNAPPVRRRKKSGWRVLGIILAAILLTGGLLYLFWLGPTLQRPVSAPLALPTLEEAPATPVAGGTAETPIAGTPPAGARAEFREGLAAMLDRRPADFPAAAAAARR